MRLRRSPPDEACGSAEASDLSGREAEVASHAKAKDPPTRRERSAPVNPVFDPLLANREEYTEIAVRETR
jgi:hypothetical protein